MQNNIIFKSDIDEFILSDTFFSGGYFTFGIKIKSGDFSGASSFCIFMEEIKAILVLLSLMNNTLEGTCSIKDSDSDSYITLEMQKYGHVKVLGQIGGTHQDQYMKFSYILDQTILISLIDFFTRELSRAA